MDPPAALRARRTSSSGRDAESSVASRLPWFFRAVRGRLPAQPSRQLGHKLAETVALVLQCVPSYGLVPAAPKRLDLPRPARSEDVCQPTRPVNLAINSPKRSRSCSSVCLPTASYPPRLSASISLAPSSSKVPQSPPKDSAASKRAGT